MNPGTLLEDKGCALALHYRAAPRARGGVAAGRAGIVAALGPDYHVLEGSSVLRDQARAMFNKADAIRAFLREPPFAGRRPIFIGDDFTDLDGFAAVEAGGGYPWPSATGSTARCAWHRRETCAPCSPDWPQGS